MFILYLMAFLAVIGDQPVNAFGCFDTGNLSPPIKYERFIFYPKDCRFSGGFWDQIAPLKSAIINACKDERGYKHLSEKTYNKITGYLTELEETLKGIFFSIHLDPALIKVTPVTEKKYPRFTKKEGKLITLVSDLQNHPIIAEINGAMPDNLEIFSNFKHAAAYLMVFLKECSDRIKINSELDPDYLQRYFSSLSREEFDSIANFYDNLVVEVEAFQDEIRKLKSGEKYSLSEESSTDLEKSDT